MIVEVEEDSAQADGDTAETEQFVGGGDAVKDYIYLGDWRMKIRIPEDAYGITYYFNPDTLYVSARKGKGNFFPEFQAYVQQNVTGLGALSQVRKADSTVRIVTDANGEKMLTRQLPDGESGETSGVIVYEDDRYYYLYLFLPV